MRGYLRSRNAEIDKGTNRPCALQAAVAPHPRWNAMLSKQCSCHRLPSIFAPIGVAHRYYDNIRILAKDLQRGSHPQLSGTRPGDARQHEHRAFSAGSFHHPLRRNSPQRNV